MEAADFLRTEKTVKKLELDDKVEEDEERKDRQPMSLSILLKRATEKKTSKDDSVSKRLPNDKMRDYSEFKKKLGNDLSRTSNVTKFRKSVSVVKLPVRKSFIMPKDKNILIPKKSNLKIVKQ